MDMKDRIQQQMDYTDVSTKRDSSWKATATIAVIVAVVVIAFVCVLHFALGMSLLEILGGQ